MPVYAATGASGHLGRFAVQGLLARGVPPSEVAAVVRTAGKAADLAARGVQVREADYSRPQTLGPALDGVDRLLLVSGNEPGQRVIQHANLIGAARMAGVSRIVFTSMLNADRTTSPVAGDYRDSERVLREAGMPFTALRNGTFFADLIFSNGKEVSARPSDSIALALRTGATIFAADEILEEAGIAIPDEQEDEVEKFREFLDTITPEDFGRAT